jgi:hypothetical protein
MAGFTARYEYGVITHRENEDTNSAVARGVTVGMRFPSAQVIRFCDCKAIQLQSVIKSDGRWRVVVFGGDVNRQDHRERLGTVSWRRGEYLICMLTTDSLRTAFSPSRGDTHRHPSTSTVSSSLSWC